jgi:tetratricopeptide (TPR) repeat protein
VIPTEPSGHPYLLPVAKLGDMHLCLGEAYLAWAVNSRGKEALEFYNRAMANAQSAIQLNVLRYQTNKLLALGFLFQEAFGDGSQEALGVARGRLAVATKQLEAMGREREILSAFNQPASPARVQSLACLAMSRAALKTARQARPANGDPADLAESLQSSLDWAQRAADLDPELGEAFWLQALAYQVLGDWLNTTNRSMAARARNDCIKALKAIQPGSPRYAQARNLLAAMAP